MHGTGCATQKKAASWIDCEPEIIIQETLIDIPADLLLVHENPSIPAHGDNAALLDWAMACAANTRKYSDQMIRLKELQTQ